MKQPNICIYMSGRGCRQRCYTLQHLCNAASADTAVLAAAAAAVITLLLSPGDVL
jgi:hypothetical protein